MDHGELMNNNEKDENRPNWANFPEGEFLIFIIKILLFNLKFKRMKKLSKIKLNQFSKDELDRRKMNALKGGCECYVSCHCQCSSGYWHGITLFGASYNPTESNANSYTY